MAVLLTVLGCSSEPPKPNECPGARAAFAVTLSAQGSPLPSDTALQVTFSGGQETYELAAPSDALEAVRCEPVTEGETIIGLECALWTLGPADVTVLATGFATLTESLAHEVDDCGVRTVDVALVLQPLAP